MSDQIPTANEAKSNAKKQQNLKPADTAFYKAWNKMLEWMHEYAENRKSAMFEKEADFPDYIYRMERPYDLPTTIMSASLSDLEGNPILMLNASPRHALFKEIVLHPFESHVYRKLKYSSDKDALVESKRVFTKEMLFELADDLFHVVA